MKKIAHFDDPDAAAFSSAMKVHAILDYESDLKFSGLDNKFQGYDWKSMAASDLSAMDAPSRMLM